jgi:hypothetical protein
MQVFRIHRMKDAPRQQFRWAPHVSGCASARPRDYEAGGEIEAANEYDAWQALRATGQPLALGDLLENEKGELRICKYVGFEAAQWVVPEQKPRADAVVPDPSPAAQPVS